MSRTIGMNDFNSFTSQILAVRPNVGVEVDLILVLTFTSEQGLSFLHEHGIIHRDIKSTLFGQKLVLPTFSSHLLGRHQHSDHKRLCAQDLRSGSMPPVSYS